MEDLWKDITLSSLHNPSATTPHLQTPPHHNHNNIHPNLTTTTIFQDFLARPFTSETQTIPINSTTSNQNNNSPPQIIPSLNYPDFHLGDSSSSHSPPPYNPFDFSCSSAHHHKPRHPETECDEMNMNSSQHPSDRRHKRMIKNRESAARSRARKQAYTTELELQVAQLKRENALLRMEEEMHNQAAALDQLQKKHKLQRTSTAPF